MAQSRVRIRRFCGKVIFKGNLYFYENKSFETRRRHNPKILTYRKICTTLTKEIYFEIIAKSSKQGKWYNLGMHATKVPIGFAFNHTVVLIALEFCPSLTAFCTLAKVPKTRWCVSAIVYGNSLRFFPYQIDIWGAQNTMDRGTNEMKDV